MNTARDIVMAKYPNEKWLDSFNNEPLGINIKMAETRAPINKQQRDFFMKELEQARLLANEGKSVYFLPEKGAEGEKHPDAIIDGRVTELKTVTGKLEKVWKNFNTARKKSSEPIDVFLYIDSKDKNISLKNIRNLLSGKIKQNNLEGGRIIIRISGANTTHFWNVDDLIK
jgi:hypothetical protein